MATVHPSAMVHAGANLAEDVSVGPFCVVHNDVQIEAGTSLESNVVLESGTRIGKNCRLSPGCVLGGPPQDHKYRGERSLLTIGDNNTIREFVTIHRAVGEGVATRIGNDNMFMAYAHVGHNCEIGNNNTFSSYVGLSGHVVVEDNTVFGGMVGIHQFCRIGKMAMIGGMSKININIPPFMLADGSPCRVMDLNTIGLRRHGVQPTVRAILRQAYKLLYRSNLNLSQAMERIEDELEPCEELEYLILFLRIGGFGGRGTQEPRA